MRLSYHEKLKEEVSKITVDSPSGLNTFDFCSGADYRKVAENVFLRLQRGKRFAGSPNLMVAVPKDYWVKGF